MIWQEGRWLENDDAHICDRCGLAPFHVVMGVEQLLCGDCDAPIGGGPDPQESSGLDATESCLEAMGIERRSDAQFYEGY